MHPSVHKYLRETKRPVYSAALVLPFFVVYHTGTFVFRTTYINGADALIIRMLSFVSVHSLLASALVLVISFVVWQLRVRASWRIDRRKLALLFLESALYACSLLILFGWLAAQRVFASPASGGQGPFERLVLYCGAGVYEELLFRGFMLGGLLLLTTRVLGMSKVGGAFLSTVLAALLFAAFHYVGPTGDPLALDSFVQRTLGGLYFSALFVTRGFGVTAASHAMYDILVDWIRM